MRLILGSDYDHTYRLEKEIHPRELDAVRKFREAGNLFGIVSGRNVHEMHGGVIETLRGEYDFLICSEGAVCIMPDGSHLFADTLPGKYLPVIYEAAVELGAFILFFDAAGYTSADELPDGIFPDEGEDLGVRADICFHVPDGGFQRPVRPDRMGDIKSFNMCGFVFPNLDMSRIALRTLSERFGSEFVFHSNHNNVSVTAPGVNKATALAKYAAAVGVPADNVYAAGDSLNDIDMIREFKGFVMDTCIYPEMFDLAYATASNVAEVIEMISK